MGFKALSALLTVIAGVGGAVVLFWLLNKLAELLPDKLEHRVKPYLFILPAFLAIVVYLVYPAILTINNSFKDNLSLKYVGFRNYTDLFSSHEFIQTLINTLLWIIIVPTATVIVGLMSKVALATKSEGSGLRESRSGRSWYLCSAASNPSAPE